MLTLTHRPTGPAPDEPAVKTVAQTDESCGPAPKQADDDEEPRTFLRILLRALGAMHT
jgi:hypothetical protein